MNNLLISSPWLLLILVLSAALATWFLYRKNPFGDEPGPRSWMFRLMAVARFVGILSLLVLLLSPILSSSTKKTEKPVLLLAVDNSQSMLLASDSSFLKNELALELSAIRENLAAKYTVRTLAFGEAVRDMESLDFTDRLTDFNMLFDEVRNRFYGRNVGSMVIISDGIFNAGNNPLYATGLPDAPLFTIATGDTFTRRDISIREVRHNANAVKGNKFPLEVNIRAANCNGEQVFLKIVDDDGELYSENIFINSNTFSKLARVLIDAPKAGRRHLVATITTVANEASNANNRKDIYIDIIESKQKVLVVMDAPHPDVAALRAVISTKDNLEFEAVLAKDFNMNLSEVQLLVFHQLPSVQQSAEVLINEALRRNVPMLFILGDRTNFEMLNRLTTGIKISGRTATINEALPTFNQQFSYFALPPQVFAVNVFPPLFAPYGTYSNFNAANTLAFQQIGSVKTEQPLIYLDESLMPRQAFVFGTGIWRWRIYEQEKSGNTSISDALFGQIIQFLITREDKSKFKVFSAKSTFYENERAVLQALVYDANYQPTTTPDVELTLKDEEGKRFTFRFSRQTGQYALDMGSLTSGRYTYSAKVLTDYDYPIINGSLDILPLQLEEQQLQADYGLMGNLALQNGGKALQLSDLKKLPEILASIPEMTPVSYMELRSKMLIDEWWWLAIIFLWLTLEWITRRRAGFY